MAILLECYRIIIPIHKIIEKYPGGWQQCLADHKDLINGRVWYDQHLFSDGAMNPNDIEILADKWESFGFTGYVGDDITGRWVDYCICDMIIGPYACDWLTRKGMAVHLKGTEPGEIIANDLLIEMFVKKRPSSQ